jgi:quercetin dioxygenase-like cupin family protein
VTKLLQVAAGALLVLVSSAALADQDKERALTRTWDDPELKWGPCPAFIPEGCKIAVLHGDPSKKNADVFFKVPENFVIPKHWHTSAERMVLVNGELVVDYAGQNAKELKPGMYAYGPAKLEHKATCGNKGPCVLFIAFEGPVDAFEAKKDEKKK